MKILLVYQRCQIGGVEIFMASLAAGLRKQGHECDLFFFEHGPLEKCLPSDGSVHWGGMSDCLLRLRAGGYDLVHASSTGWNYGLSAVRVLGVHLVVTTHGMVVPGWNSTNCDAFASTSSWQIEQQRRFTDLPIHLVYNGIDLSTFSPAPDVYPADGSPVVAWVGRSIADGKRVDRLASLAPALVAAGLRLWIADPSGRDRLASIRPAEARVLGSTSEFWGRVDRADLPHFYQRVAASGGCILSTSVDEGFGLALAEAQACGCFAAGPNVPGVNEVVRPEHGGLLYPPDTEPEALAKLLRETTADAEGSRWRRQASVRFVRERFDLNRMVDQYIGIYEETLARPRPGLAGLTRRQARPLIPRKPSARDRRHAGLAFFGISRRLWQSGEWNLARAVARLALGMYPTQFASPTRLAHLVRVFLRSPVSRNQPEAPTIRAGNVERMSGTADSAPSTPPSRPQRRRSID